MMQSRASSQTFSSVSALRMPARSPEQARRRRVGGGPPRPVGGGQARDDDEDDDEGRDDQRDDDGDTEGRVVAHGVREVELGDVDPVLLRELDEDPQAGGDEQPEAGGEARRLVAQARDLVGDEEVLERVREQQQHQAVVGELEERDADEAVVEEEPRDP